MKADEVNRETRTKRPAVASAGGRLINSQRWKGTARQRVADYGIVVLFVALIIVGGIVYNEFFSGGNLRSILSESAPLGVVAIGETFVIIGAGFDLSVGSTYAIGATVFALVGNAHSWLLAGFLAVLLGLALGAINGVVVTQLKVNPFIATFGTGSIYSGGVLLLTNNTAYPLDRYSELGAGDIGGIPVSAIVLAVLLVVGGVVLHRSVYGRKVYAVGGNDEASHLAGLRVGLIRGGTYVMSGGMAAFAGVMEASLLGSGQGNIGTNTALDSIAIVVIGGTALLGGEGAMWRTAVGLLIIGILDNIFFGLALNANWQTVVTGAILIAAVAFDMLVRRGSQT
ncbi:MAG: ABC transporter permease [Streptosporangiaceae bacterium]